MRGSDVRRYRVGERVALRWERPVRCVTVVEDRGPLGVDGELVYRVAEETGDGDVTHYEQAASMLAPLPRARREVQGAPAAASSRRSAKPSPSARSR